jgi:DNA end-binding protein Ku
MIFDPTGTSSRVFLISLTGSTITPRTAYEVQILEFVKLAEVDPIYFETSYYVAPDDAGERSCALLFQALRTSGFVAIAQVEMHRREHVVVIRPGRTGVVLHSMFYEPEIRREDEFRTEVANVRQGTGTRASSGKQPSSAV